MAISLFILVMVLSACAALGHLWQRARILSHFPGPWHTAYTACIAQMHCFKGDEATWITSLHTRYGPVVRIGPRELSFSDGDVIHQIYSEGTSFKKAPYFSNSDIDGQSTMFSEQDPASRNEKAKQLRKLFYKDALLNARAQVTKIASHLIKRTELEKQAGWSKGLVSEINILTLARSFVLDAISSAMFGEAYGALNEVFQGKSGVMSASPAVDECARYGKWFYHAPSVSKLLMRIEGYFMDSETVQSFEKIDQYLWSQVQREADPDTYQGCFLLNGLSQAEVVAQCKDVVFAGTDSTGMNFVNLMWNLARDQSMYESISLDIRSGASFLT